MWTILVTEPLNDQTLAYLGEHGQIVHCAAEEAPDHIADADALVVRTYTQVNEALLALAPKLKVVGRAGVALENIDVPACRARGVEVVHTPAANTLAVVDYTIAHLIAMNRRFWPMAGAMSAEEFHTARKQSFGRFLATMTLGVAEFIRGLGYTALPMLNDIGMSIPLAIDAGLGQLGRHGLVITPQFGPRLRMCKVLTDMPAERDRPIDFGVTAFCERCKKCAIHCPAGAISHGARSREVETISSNPGTLKWPFNAEKCRTYQMKVGSNCCTCIRVCPFNKSSHWFHSVVRWFIETVPPLNPLMIKMDDVFGFGKFKDPEAHFWR